MTGVGRYTFNLLSALSRRPELKIRAIVQSRVIPLLEKYANIQQVEWLPQRAAHSSHPANEWWLWRGVRGVIQPGEVYHGPAFIAPLGRQNFARIATIHDLFVFDDPFFY